MILVGVTELIQIVNKLIEICGTVTLKRSVDICILTVAL